MIVSLPQISVTTPPQAAGGGSAIPGKFSTALAEANQNTQPTAKPAVDNELESSNGETASAKPKLNTGAKPSASSLNSVPKAQAPAANLPTDNNAYVICNPPSALLPLMPQSTGTAEPEAISTLEPAGTQECEPSAATVLPTEAASGPSTTASASSTLSAPARMLAPSPQPTSVPAQRADQQSPAPQAATPSLTPGGNSTPAVAASMPEASAKFAVGEAKMPTSAEADAKQVISNVPSAGATTPKSTTVDPKPISREAADSFGPIDPKSPTGYSSTKPQEVTGDGLQVIGDGLQKTIVPPFPAVPPPSIKSELWPQAQPSQGVASESDSGIVPPPSETLRGDGDAAQNPPPSDRSSGSASGVVPTPKQDFDNAMTQAAGAPPSTVTGSTQVSALVDNRPVASTASPKTTDVTPKNLGQAPAVADAEPPAEAPGLHIGSPLQVAKLMERAGETELRVGIQAGEFGSVDIRTSMARGQMSAEISVERGELGRAMTAELPALHNRFEEQRLPLANIILQDHSHAGGSGNAGQGQRQQQYMQPIKIFGDDDANAAAPIVATEVLETSSRLDVHI